MSNLKLPKWGLTLLFAVSAYVVNSQTSSLTLEYSESAELVVNDFSITKKTTIDKLIKVIGEPSKTVNYPSGEVGYFYEESGLVFFGQSEAIKGVGVNFNWDGDEKYPETSFGGSLLLGELEITKDTKSEEIAEISSIEFICPIPMMCASKDKSAKINCTVAFKDENLTQVVFIIK